jgi:hypothetical protein
LKNFNFNDLFTHIQLLTYDGQPTPSKALVPSSTTVRERTLFGGIVKKSNKKNSSNKPRYTLNDLIIDPIYGFNKTTKAILCPFTKKEYETREKE